MSEQLIQKLLDIGGCDAETEWAKGYDDGVNTAIDIVEKYFEKPTLNENQMIVLEMLKSNYLPKLEISGMFAIYKLMDDVIEDNWQEYSEEMPPNIKAMGNINSFKEQNQILQAFAEWAQEQEEE